MGLTEEVGSSTCGNECSVLQTRNIVSCARKSNQRAALPLFHPTRSTLLISNEHGFKPIGELLLKSEGRHRSAMRTHYRTKEQVKGMILFQQAHLLISGLSIINIWDRGLQISEVRLTSIYKLF